MAETIDVPAPKPSLFRVIDPSDYDSEKGRFVSLAFRPSSNGGISVVEYECALIKSGSVCQHIQKYYKGQTKHSGYYWPIPNDALPLDCVIDGSNPSTTGDECHKEIYNWGKEATRKYFKTVPIEHILICENGIERALTKGDLE